MNKIESFEWATKLMEAISALPDDAEIHNFELVLNTDSKPYRQILDIHLSKPVDGFPATDGKRFSGWVEKRVWLRPNVYIWWPEDIDGKSATS